MIDFVKYEVVDLKKIPVHMQIDFHTRNENVSASKKLCKRCNGTGNELFSMFRLCTDCRGTGIAKENNGTEARNSDSN